MCLCVVYCICLHETLCTVCEMISLLFVLTIRLLQLMEEIMAEKENKTIIFVETKKRCDDLTRRMRRDG